MLLAQKHLGSQVSRRSEKRNGFAGKLLPGTRRRLHALQPASLFRVTSYQAEESCELGIQLLRSFMVGLKEDRIAGEQKSSQSRFFIDHQLDQVVGVGDHLVGPVNPASTLLRLAEAVSRNQRKRGQGKDGQCEKADQQTSIRGSFQWVSRGGPSTVKTSTRRELLRRTLQFCLIICSTGNGSDRTSFVRQHAPIRFDVNLCPRVGHLGRSISHYFAG